MSGFFIKGETKERPGLYKRIEDITTYPQVRERIGCAVVSANWGPIGVPKLIQRTDDWAKIIGSGSGYDTLKEMFVGGAKKVVLVRVGSTGTKATLTLTDDASTPVNVVTLTAKYAGTYPLAISIKADLNDASVKNVTIYTGDTVLEKFKIAAGTAEIDGIVAELVNSEYIDATKLAAGSGTLDDVTKSSLTGGADPTVNTTAYADGLEAANTEVFDTICVDTNDTAVHAVLAAFVERIYKEGDYPITVISEPKTVARATRLAHAAAYNNEKIVYVLGSWKDAAGTVYSGYKAAARIAGMITAIPCNNSLTHKPIEGAVELDEALTNSQIIEAIRSGCLIISKSKTSDVMIEKAINTLVVPGPDQDAGWKKIRRVMTRFEMMSRIDVTLEPFVGSVNNDPDGRAAIIAAAQSVLDAMIGEGKLFPGATVFLDENNPPIADSAWFIIQADDIDSFEIGYLTYQFRFAPEE